MESIVLICYVVEGILTERFVADELMMLIPDFS